MVTTKTKQVLRREPGVQMSETSPGLVEQLKWMSTRLILSSMGRLSKGIRLGYRFGFDSGTMLDYVYVNQAQGALGIGVLFDRLYLNAVGWRAIRARSVLLQSKLCQEVGRNRAQNAPTRLLDVASGPGRYLQSLLASCGSEMGDLRILCRDLATPGLVQGKKLAKERALQHIFYEPGDAFAPASTDELLGGAPNVIVVSGLYELLLDDDLIQRSLKQLYELLAPGGSLYFTTQIQHPQLDFIANVLPNRDGKPWIMKCRPVSLLEEWMQSAGFVQVQSEVEAVGLFAVTQGCKIA